MRHDQTQIRIERGLDIAKNTRIVSTEKGWKVPSQNGSGYYLVQSNGHESTCTCPDYQNKKVKCKHIWAVEFIVTNSVKSQDTLTIKAVKNTYKQDWSAYDEATINQKSTFMDLLKDITIQIPQPEYKGGRPTLPISDMAYASIMKVYTTFSLRRFMGDMETA